MSTIRICCITLSLLTAAFFPTLSFSAPTDADKLKTLLDRECTNLKKDKLFNLLEKKFSSEIEKGFPLDLLKIMEGVIKRTDFDGIKEEKTVEIIGLVYDAFKKGAPLEYLDQIFDVAYAKTISVNQLYAAAKALKEFNDSDVPPEIYEEFVYKSIEDKWDPAAVPVLARGLIYGVDRGLTPQRVALSIMIDLEKGELKNKGAEQLVLDAIKFVRKIEPEKWKPLSEAEKALAMRREKKRELERVRRETEAKKADAEKERRKAEEELRKIAEAGRLKADEEKRARELQDKMKVKESEVRKYKQELAEVGDAIGDLIEEIERKEDEKRTARNEGRRKELDIVKQKIKEFGLSAAPETNKLYAAVDKYLGIPYRYGGDSESGIDCSAFTRRVYRELGTELPRTSREQAKVGNTVDGGSMQLGDLVFFDTSIIGGISHVGVYLDNDTFAHASSNGVTKSSLKERYYSKRFVKGNRIFNMKRRG